MADCFSLENTDELLERLHNRARSCATDKALIYYDAIDIIEQLLSENTKLKAERDAAIADIVKMCPNCKYVNCDWFSKECKDCNHKEKWEWRGVKEEEE